MFILSIYRFVVDCGYANGCQVYNVATQQYFDTHEYWVTFTRDNDFYRPMYHGRYFDIENNIKYSAEKETLVKWVTISGVIQLWKLNDHD